MFEKEALIDIDDVETDIVPVLATQTTPAG
jgi:hypothetical protein